MLLEKPQTAVEMLQLLAPFALENNHWILGYNHVMQNEVWGNTNEIFEKIVVWRQKIHFGLDPALIKHDLVNLVRIKFLFSLIKRFF